MKTEKSSIFALLFLLLVPSGFRAAGGSWRLGPEPQAYILNNGLSVILQNDDSSASTVVQLLVRGGDRDDPPGQPGLAYLTSRLALEIPDQSKLQQLMDFGSSFSLAVSGDFSLITIRSLSRYLDEALAVAAAILAKPLFSDLRIDGVKGLMLHLQKMETDNPVACMGAVTARTFFGASAYGASRFGDASSLSKIRKKDIQAFFQTHFVAGNMVAVVISDLDADFIKPLIAQRFGGLPAGPRPALQPVRVRKAEPPQLAVIRQSAQTHISRSVLLPELTAENFLLATLLETWLGKGIGCRLWPLRSRSDLAYGLNAEVLPYREAMLLNVAMQTDQRRAKQAQAELEQLLKAVYDNGIGAAELEAAKAFACAEFWRDNETREQRAATMAFLEGQGLSHRLAGDFGELLGKIDRDRFNDFLRTWLAPDRWFSLHIGPAAE